MLALGTMQPSPSPIVVPPERYHRAAQAIAQTAAVLGRLRAPDGCAWTRRQTIEDLWPYLIEEAHEAAHAARRGDLAELSVELGDVLLQILYLSDIADDAGAFTLVDVAQALERKLIRRHPHVFADSTAHTPAQIAAQWEAIKAEERREKAARAPTPEVAEGRLDGLPTTLPALIGAQRAQDKAADLDPRALPQGDAEELTEAEVGARLWQLVRAAGAQGIDAERALHAATTAYRRDVSKVEALWRAHGEPNTAQLTLDDLQQLWDEALSRSRT